MAGTRVKIKHRHHRGKKAKSVKHKRVSNSLFSVTYCNTQNLGTAKRVELSNLLENEKISIYSMTETFHENDGAFQILHPDYLWIGKTRCDSNKKTGGGIGFLVNKIQPAYVMITYLNQKMIVMRDCG